MEYRAVVPWHRLKPVPYIPATLALQARVALSINTQRNMKLFKRGKDGGAESTVTGYWLCEFKSLFSIVLLKFENGTRDAFHTHAFNSVSWLLRGKLIEHLHNSDRIGVYLPSLRPIHTSEETYHKVESVGRTWVLSFRGPWAKTWQEYTADGERTLTHGRVEV